MNSSFSPLIKMEDRQAMTKSSRTLLRPRIIAAATARHPLSLPPVPSRIYRPRNNAHVEEGRHARPSMCSGYISRPFEGPLGDCSPLCPPERLSKLIGRFSGNNAGGALWGKFLRDEVMRGWRVGGRVKFKQSF